MARSAHPLISGQEAAILGARFYATRTGNRAHEARHPCVRWHPRLTPIAMAISASRRTHTSCESQVRDSIRQPGRIWHANGRNSARRQGLTTPDDNSSASDAQRANTGMTPAQSSILTTTARGFTSSAPDKTSPFTNAPDQDNKTITMSSRRSDPYSAREEAGPGVAKCEDHPDHLYKRKKRTSFSAYGSFANRATLSPHQKRPL